MQTRTVEYHNGAETYNADRLGSVVIIFNAMLSFFCYHKKGQQTAQTGGKEHERMEQL